MDLLEYLKNPFLVAKIQNFFGLYRLRTDDNGKVQQVDAHQLEQEHALLGETNVKEGILGESHKDKKGQTYKVNSYFWHCVFLVGAALGNEACHISVLPCWFWNVDSAVGRRVIFLWVTIFSLGQSLKEVFQWLRPASPPVVVLESKRHNEYGMPSTHSIAGVTIPFGVLICTYNRYEYDVWLGLILATTWAVLVCMSRLYLGVHTVADVIAGVLLSVVFMSLILPVSDAIDSFLLTSTFSPLVLLSCSLAILVFHPVGDYWTPTRGDTAVCLGVLVGVHMASWIQYEWGIIRGPPMSPPFKVMWPNLEIWKLYLFRTLIGFVIAAITKYKVKYSCLLISKSVLGGEKGVTEDVRIDLGTKFLTYFMVAFNVVFTTPAVFRYLGIHRPSLYTEI